MFINMWTTCGLSEELMWILFLKDFLTFLSPIHPHLIPRISTEFSFAQILAVKGFEGVILFSTAPTTKKTKVFNILYISQRTKGVINT